MSKGSQASYCVGFPLHSSYCGLTPHWVLCAAADDNDEKGGIYMVLEYMDHDLTGLARRAGKFSVPQTKVYMSKASSQ